jgi:predicted transcriptional regulator
MRTVSVRLNDADSVRLDALARLWVMDPNEAMRKLIRDRAEILRDLKSKTHL